MEYFDLISNDNRGLPTLKVFKLFILNRDKYMYQINLIIRVMLHSKHKLLVFYLLTDRGQFQQL